MSRLLITLSVLLSFRAYSLDRYCHYFLDSCREKNCFSSAFSNGIPANRKFKSVYTNYDLQTLDKIKKVYCPKAREVCKRELLKLKRTGKSNLITVTYSGIIPSLQCLKCDFNLFGDGGVAIGLGTSWEVEHYFKVDIPKFKRVEDFQACKNAYNMCKLKINSFKKLKDFPYNRCRIDYSFDHQL